MFGEPNFLGAATYPATCILTGYRYLPSSSCLADFLLDGSENKILQHILIMFFLVSRAVPLKNGHSEELELSSLLVKVSSF